MRNATLCFLLLLCSVIAVGQEPQWKVIKHVILMQQTKSGGGTLLIPTEPGVYRLNLYFSESGGEKQSNAYYTAQLHGTDITGGSVDFGELLYCSHPGAVWMPPIMVSLKPQEPLTYYTSALLAPTASCQYNLAITVEQLVQ